MPPKKKAADETASTDVQRAAEARQAAAQRGERTEEFVAALLEERRGYVVRDLGDRVAEVDEQIRLYGGEVPKD